MGGVRGSGGEGDGLEVEVIKSEKKVRLSGLL